MSALTLSSVTPVALTASAADTDTSVTQTSGTENPIIKNSDFSKYATGALPVTLDMIDDEHIVDSVAEYREYLDGNDSDSLLPKKSKIQSSSKSSALPVQLTTALTRMQSISQRSVIRVHLVHVFPGLPVITR